MRDYYPSVLLYGNDSKLLENFCNCIRFSTHCNYIVVSNKEPICTEGYEYIKWIDLNDIQLSKDIKADVIIKFDDSKIQVSDNGDFLNHEASNHQSPDEVMKLQSRLSEYIDTNCFNSLIEYVGDLRGFIVFFDILIDYEGDVNVIGGLKVAKSKDSCDHHVFDPRELASLEFFKKIKSADLKESTLLSLEISECEINGMYTQCRLNKFFNHWEIYRAVGINVPLILVQNLLHRKIKTYKFVDSSSLVFRGSNLKPVFNFDFDTIYFDLDETLVWNWKPITELVEFLHDQRKKGITLKIITRHTYDVSETLAKIGLKCELFKRIIVVAPHELKSSHITDNSIFIDNEFPQRLDVRLKNRIPVLDLDQIDFF